MNAKNDREDTERTRLMKALPEFESLTDIIFRSIRSGIVVQGRDGKITYANHIAEETFRLSEGEMRARTSEDPAWNMIMEDGTPVAGSEHPSMITLTTGRALENQVRGIFAGDPDKFRWLLINTEPVFASGSELPEKVVVTFTDITELKRAEESKENLERQLMRAQRMESVGRLAGGLAHDFNNLITGITGNVSLALMDLSPEDPLSKSLLEINKAAESAAELTHQLLAFSRKQIIKPKVVDVNELVSSTHEMLKRLIGEDVALVTRPSSGKCNILADWGQLEQVLVNLAVNARDAMPSGGRLEIVAKTTEVGRDEFHDLPEMVKGSYVCIAIADDGEGMDEATLIHIFDPFFTTKKEGKGTGLGLAMVYGIVRQHGGHVRVSSRPGEGTVFHIFFPAVKEQAEVSSRRPSVMDLPAGNETILVVEDDAMVRDVATKILTRRGFVVLAACSGEEALALAKRRGDRVDLLLTDIVMPEMNGRELAERLTEAHPTLKILYTSGYTEDVIAQHGILEKGIEFIGKPYRPDKLLSRVRAVLDKK